MNEQLSKDAISLPSYGAWACTAEKLVLERVRGSSSHNRLLGGAGHGEEKCMSCESTGVFDDKPFSVAEA